MLVLQRLRCLSPKLLVKAEASVEREVELREHFRLGGFARINIDGLLDANIIDYINEMKKFD